MIVSAEIGRAAALLTAGAPHLDLGNFRPSVIGRAAALLTAGAPHLDLGNFRPSVIGRAAAKTDFPIWPRLAGRAAALLDSCSGLGFAVQIRGLKNLNNFLIGLSHDRLCLCQISGQTSNIGVFITDFSSHLQYHPFSSPFPTDG